MPADCEFFTDDLAARRLVDDPSLGWYHRFALSAGVVSPGGSDVEQLLDTMLVPASFAGLSVLDIGTIDGGFAFAAERRGAARVVATEFRDRGGYAFSEVAAAIGSRVEYLRASVYELPTVLQEKFDIVFFRGVLYHLRHPLLGIEAVRTVSSDRVIVETAVSRNGSGAAFYPNEYRGDPTVWFIPSRQCVLDWFGSSGFDISLTAAWAQYPEQDRALFDARADSPPSQLTQGPRR